MKTLKIIGLSVVLGAALLVIFNKIILAILQQMFMNF